MKLYFSVALIFVIFVLDVNCWGVPQWYRAYARRLASHSPTRSAVDLAKRQTNRQAGFTLRANHFKLAEEVGKVHAARRPTTAQRYYQVYENAENPPHLQVFYQEETTKHLETKFGRVPIPQDIVEEIAEISKGEWYYFEERTWDDLIPPYEEIKYSEYIRQRNSNLLARIREKYSLNDNVLDAAEDDPFALKAILDTEIIPVQQLNDLFNSGSHIKKELLKNLAKYNRYYKDHLTRKPKLKFQYPFGNFILYKLEQPVLFIMDSLIQKVISDQDVKLLGRKWQQYKFELLAEEVLENPKFMDGKTLQQLLR